MNTPYTRYIVNNDDEGDIHAVPSKAEAFALARRWADDSASKRAPWYTWAVWVRKCTSPRAES